MTHYKKHIFLCANQRSDGKKACANQSTGAFSAREAESLLRSACVEHNAQRPYTHDNKIRLTTTSCLGRCKSGPWLVVYPEGNWHHYESKADIDNIIKEEIVDNT